MMNTPTERKRALITGATSGIGEAYARAWAEKGYDLILTGRRRDVIEHVAQQIEQEYQVKAEVVIIELSDEKELDLFIEKVKDEGPIHVLVNNAGFTSKGLYHLHNITNEVNMVRVHAIAMMRLTHAVLPGMLERRSGAIINVASIQAVTPMSLSTTYCSVKAFMKNFSICIHSEVKDYGVKVQCVLPGFTRSDLGRTIGVDMNTMGDKGMVNWMLPEEVVRVSLRDLKKKNKVISIPGAGNKMLYTLIKMLPDRIWLALIPGISKKMP
jgi:hypothetical protein